MNLVLTGQTVILLDRERASVQDLNVDKTI